MVVFMGDLWSAEVREWEMNGGWAATYNGICVDLIEKSSECNECLYREANWR
jgi:hypothetical protein